METSIKKADAPSASEEAGAATCSSKRPYEPPALVEWGTIISLTQGAVASFEDADVGGTQQV
jgi:hypothetical protein